MVRGHDQVRRIVEFDTPRTEKGRARQRTLRPVVPAQFTFLEALGAAQHQMYVHDLPAMRTKQRTKPRTHPGRIQDDASPLRERAFKAPVQLGKHFIAAAPLFVRERKPHAVRTQVHGPVLGGEAGCERGFAGADRAGYGEDETQGSYRSRRVAGMSGVAPPGSGFASSD